MSKFNVEKTIEKNLRKQKLIYDKVREKGLLQFTVYNVAENLNIAVMDDFVTLKCSLMTEDDVKKMNNILYRLGWTFKDITYSKKTIEAFTVFTIDIYPFSKKTFEATIEDIVSNFSVKAKESKQPIQSVEQTPKEFFLNEYKSFQAIPEEEKIGALESILQIKEKYFRSLRTMESIKNKLFKLKEDALENSESVDLEEFFLLDYAALFRVIELNLLKLSLKDFFDNFRGEIRK